MDVERALAIRNEVEEKPVRPISPDRHCALLSGLYRYRVS